MYKLEILVISLIITFLFPICVFSSPVETDIDVHVDKLKNVLNSREWKASDSAVYNRISALIGHVESPNLDILISELQKDVSSGNNLFIRDISSIKNKEKLGGYISQATVDENIINIQKEVKRNFPKSSIKIPESEFIGVYSKLPIIQKSEVMQMLEIVDVPDSLQSDLHKKSWMESRAHTAHVDSMRMSFLEKARVEYNNNLISNYRDSIANAYCENFWKTRSDSLIKSYTRAVDRSNYRFLNTYNDMKVNEMNEEILESLSEVMKYADSITYDLYLVNSKNDISKIELGNKNWYTWVWLKNRQNDSLGIKAEVLNRQTVVLSVDESVNFSRVSHRNRAEVKRLEYDLKDRYQLVKVKEKKIYTKPWAFGGNAYSGFTQTYLNDYWAAGGNSTASILATFKYYANYSKNKIKWENNVDSKLGLVYYVPEKDEKEEESTSRNTHKNSDNVTVTSKLGVQASKNWYYSAELTFKTQFFKGYNNKDDSEVRSSFLSPGYVTFSIGMDYKPTKELSLLLSPVSLKTTIITNPDVSRSSYGLDDNENLLNQVGSYIKWEHSKKVTNDISYVTKNTFFINFGKDDAGKNLWTKFPDLDSETTFNFKVNQFVTTTVNAHFVYDKNVVSEWTDKNGETQKGTKLQVKEYLTLGITYKF